MIGILTYEPYKVVKASNKPKNFINTRNVQYYIKLWNKKHRELHLPFALLKLQSKTVIFIKIYLMRYTSQTSYGRYY